MVNDITKPQARAAAKARRAALSPADWQQIGAAMAAKLFALPLWQQADTVFCFASMPEEPDTAPILRRALAEGKRLLLPRVLPGAGQMELVCVPDLAALRPSGRYQIPEPVSGTVVPTGALGPGTLALIPCVAATRGGVRLGHGGGYYDRFLAHAKGERLLLCPTALLFDTLPCEALDVRFAPAEILTEKGILL